MGGRRLALALGAASGLVALLVAWLADGRGARDAPPAAAARAPDPAGAGSDELRAAPAVGDGLERTPIAAVPRDAVVASAPSSGEPVELGPREAWLRVYVVALETREPVAGASVRLESPDGVGFAVAASGRASGERVGSLVTDEDGRAVFRVPAQEPLVLHARFELEPGRSARLPVRAIAPGEYRTAIVGVFVEPDRTWCARVVDGATGLPIAGATFTPAGSAFASSVFQAWSGADGGLCLALGNGIGSLVVASEGYGSVVLDPDRHDSPADAQVIELSRTASLEVLVRSAAGAPGAGARVFLWRSGTEAGPGTRESEEWSAITDAEGRAAIGALLAGTPLAAMVHGGGWLHSESLALRPGERRAVVWRLAEPGSLAGTLRDQHGSPVVGHELLLLPAAAATERIPFDPPDELVQRATTDADGRFRFLHVPTGAWRIGEPARAPSYRGRSFPSADDLVLRGLPVPGDDAREGVAVEASAVVLGPGAELDVVLRAWRGLTIRGRLAGHEDVEGLLVRATGATDASAATRASGEFEVGPLLPGEYVLTAQFPGGKLGHGRAIAGATDVEIREIW